MSRSAGKKVLLTTVCQEKGETFDFLYGGFPGFFRFSIPRVISYGLRFIKQNVPEVEILEYPTWKEYVRKLEEGWDVVGFSFYLNEVPEILEMVDVARRKGVPEIWGGNYGALTEAVQPYFDRVFVGYAEGEIARFFGRRVKKLVHPPLVYYFASPLRFLKITRYGVLFTSRGCPYNCSFCQIRVFCPKPHTIPIESIDRVLRYYRDHGFRYVGILDDNFGVFKRHSDEVISLLEEYGLLWIPMVRTDILRENWEDWSERGLAGAIVGIESLDQENLDSIGKGQRVEDVYELIEMVKSSTPSPSMRFHGRHLLGFYVIGFENDTVRSVRENVRKLKELGIIFTQLFILTPAPQTSLWDYLNEKYGIFETDLRKFDGKHLVWNHPHIGPEEMERLLRWGMRELNSRGFLRYFFHWLPDYAFNFREYFTHFCLTNTFDYKRERFL